jgi:hypothetical protein
MPEMPNGRRRVKFREHAVKAVALKAEDAYVHTLGI